MLKARNRVPLSAEKIEQITPGQSTLADTAQILGSPNEIVWSNGVTTPVEIREGTGVVNTFMAQGEGVYERAYHYRYTLEKRSGFTIIVFSTLSYDTKYDDLFVFFNEQGVVTHVGASLDSSRASYWPFSS
jgi:hypothetical protein